MKLLLVLAALCEIAQLPAATLLLPYFEVDLDDAAAANTRFTITNVTDADRVAHVTLWTDRGYPVVGFNVHLAAYDLEVIDLYEVLRNAGETPAVHLRDAFTRGIAGDCTGVGGTHARAVGYATVDVVASNSTASVQDREYWTRDLRYDNVLTGDYESTRRGDATGGPLVHIRAFPGAGFPRTFYSRHQPPEAPRLDARQPLPSRFTSHWIQGPDVRTAMKVWREGVVRADAPCSAFAANANVAAEDVVRFDEAELGVAQVPDSRPEIPRNPLYAFPVTSMTSVADADVWPQLPNSATSGWMAVNLAVSRGDPAGAQGWVIASMAGLDRFAVDVEAPALGNGCSPVEPISNFRTGGALPIAPSPGNDDGCDISMLPAATLLLPQFRVDTEPRRSVTTLFAITNTGPEERIARVTLWTDLSVPILTFNVYLTGYDMQSIDLYDVIVRGLIGPEHGTGTGISPRGQRSVRNRDISLSGCESLPGTLTPQLAERLPRAFTDGSVPECEEVGLVHSFATGYATVDVVNNCATVAPTDPSYWTRDVGFDNVLTGDYQIVDHALGAADGAPLVHIRAIPDGDLPRTFYSRHSKGRDLRQPLPSKFAVQWTAAGGVDGATFFEIWREGAQRANTCRDYDLSSRPYTEIVLFDDEGNAVTARPTPAVPLPDARPTLPSTSRTHILDYSVFPMMPNGVTRGWAYFDLDDPDDPFATQAWIAATQFVRGRSSVRRDAVALGNGCSP
ncbi:MAG TPA: hypothetical protein VNI54_05330 [Thermoanaerobaculia bacterium]|nr:hypothetical protein [Thermoanaerobaculia bacterium]